MFDIGTLSTTISMITKLHNKLRFDHIDYKNDITLTNLRQIIEENIKIKNNIQNMDYNFNYIDNKLALLDKKLDMIMKKLDNIN